MARAAARLGVTGPLARLWQEGLPSPHRSYFSAVTLTRFVEQHGFSLAAAGSLRPLTTERLYRRIRYDRNVGAAWAVAIYLAAARPRRCWLATLGGFLSFMNPCQCLYERPLRLWEYVTFYQKFVVCGNPVLYQLNMGPILCPILKGRKGHGYEDQPNRRRGCTCSFSRCP